MNSLKLCIWSQSCLILKMNINDFYIFIEDCSNLKNLERIRQNPFCQWKHHWTRRVDFLEKIYHRSRWFINHIKLQFVFLQNAAQQIGRRRWMFWRKMQSINRHLVVRSIGSRKSSVIQMSTIFWEMLTSLIKRIARWFPVGQKSWIQGLVLWNLSLKTQFGISVLIQTGTIQRNPFTRLYSAWNDKSRTHRFQNGSILPEGQGLNFFKHKVFNLPF